MLLSSIIAQKRRVLVANAERIGTGQHSKREMKKSVARLKFMVRQLPHGVGIYCEGGCMGYEFPEKLSPQDLQRLQASCLRLNKATRIRQIQLRQPTRTTPQTTTRRTRHQRGQATRSQAASGDSPPADPEPERPRNLLDQQALADLLCISKKTLQNIYSSTPWLLPPSIQIPGARGPRWTPAAVAEWLEQRPQHTSAPIPAAPKRRAGRPRIALAGKGKGGAA